MINIKSASEIEKMRKSGRILADTLKKVEEAIKPGVSTKHLDKIAEDYILSCGAIPSFKGVPGGKGVIDFPATLCISVNDEVIHGIPGDRLLKEGDIVSIDAGVLKDGFHADAARTFPVGNVDEKAQKLIDVTKKSFFKGIEQAVVGNRIVDIGTAIQEYAEKNGYSVVKEFVGHGIGRELHEDPAVPNYRTNRKGARLCKGMAIAVEPMVNMGAADIFVLDNGWTIVTQDGKLSAHYENTIIITDGKPEILTM